MTAAQCGNNPWAEDWWREKTFRPNPRRCVALTRGQSQIPSQKHLDKEAAYSHLDCMVQHKDRLREMEESYAWIQAKESLNVLLPRPYPGLFDLDIHTKPVLKHEYQSVVLDAQDLDEHLLEFLEKIRRA